MTNLPHDTMRLTRRHRGGGFLRWPATVGSVLVPTLAMCLSFHAIGARAADPQQTADGPSASPSDQQAPQETADAAAQAGKSTCCYVRVPCRRRFGRCRIRARRYCWVRCDCAGADTPDTAEKPDPYAWKDLFDGKTLEGWKTPEFGGEGEVRVEDGTVVLEMGSMMTGITYTGEVLRDNYELAWEGARLDGIDFFATATFPVGKNECSFVTGGWGGMVVGLSCVDYYDASDNATTKFHDFKDKQWYKFRVRVTPPKIEVWIDDEQVVDQKREGHEIGIRDEVDLCRPLGISAWVTKGGVRNVRVRKLKPAKAE